MTAQERADLAVLQDQMRRTNSDVGEIKGDVKSILERLDSLDKRYVTRAELSISKWLIATVALFTGAMSGAVGLLIANWRR